MRVVAAVALLALLAPAEASAAPPSNDRFEDRKAISALPFTDSVSTTEATVDPGEPLSACGVSPGTSVWYEYTSAAADQLLHIQTTGSDYDTVVAVWTGSSLEDLTEIACNDDFGDSFHSSVFLESSPGQTFLIQVSGFGTASGNLAFSLAPSALGAISGTVTDESGEPLSNICVEVFDPATWYYVGDAHTRADGTYLMGGLPDGTYLVEFFDWCDVHADHQGEWFDDQPDMTTADPVTVRAGEVTQGIDAALAPIGLTVTKSGAGAGTVTSNPAGIDCGTDCEEPYAMGTEVTLTARPDAYSRFAGWTGCDTSDGATCTVHVGEAEAVDARFGSTTAGPALTLQRPHAGVYVNDQQRFRGGSAILVAGYVTVEVAVADLRSGLKDFQFEVNGKPVDPSQVTAQGDVRRFTFRPSAPGEHVITARATNNAGDQSSLSIHVHGVPLG